MKNSLVFLSILCVLFLTVGKLYAQNDAFFYENFEQKFEDDLMAFDFGNFSTDEFGFNFGNFSTNEFGFNFGDFSKDDNGLNFGEFDFEDVDVALGNGLLLLSGFAFVRLRFKNKKNNE